MAQREVQLNKEVICCSICLDLLKDPVTIPCGHSYCMLCVKSHWDGEDERGTHSCPQCRTTFTKRPVLKKNTMLDSLVEKLEKIGLQEAPPDRCYAGPEDVACDVCTGRRMKAIKSCLFCLVSYCEKHLQPHYDVAPLKKHKLVKPSKNLQENICSRHDEVMKMFCRTDQQSICYLCSLDEHNGHETVSDEKQEQLEGSRRQIQQKIQDGEKDAELLQQEVEAINGSADKAVEDSEKIFTELIRLIQRRSSDVKQQIRSQQETEVCRVRELQEKLQQEMDELKRRDAELEKCSHTEEHNQFLDSFPSLPAHGGASGVSIRPRRGFEDVTAAVSELRDELQEILTENGTNISPTVAGGHVLPPEPQPEPQPESRSDFLKYSREMTLDPNTANTYLLLSKRNRKATVMEERQVYPSHVDRFTDYRQVLSRESLTGRCYWEVEWRGGGVCVTVADKSIKRTGRSKKCSFGTNDKSWALYCDGNGYRFWFNKDNAAVSGPLSSRVGVYLDHGAGVLSFYSVADTRTLLHRLHATFTQPLHAGLWLSHSHGTNAAFIKVKYSQKSFNPDTVTPSRFC